MSSYATSYVPNPTTGTMTRVADVAEIGPGAEFDALFPGSTGTLVVECVPMSNTGSTGISVDDGNGGYDEYMSVYWNSGQVSFVVYSGNVSRFSTFTAGAVTAGVPLKIAIAWSDGRFGISVNGAASVEGGAGPPPIMTRARVFGDRATAAQSDGSLRKLTSYPTAIFGAALQALTT